MRVVVTGAGGFVGRAVCRSILEHGWDLVPVCRSGSGYENEVIIDFDQFDATEKFLAIKHWDAAIHLASHVDFSEDADLCSFWGTNVLATSLICSQARKNKAHVAFTSGTLVYPYRENIDRSLEPDPKSPYARAKYIAEQIILQCGVSSTILRPGGIFGIDGPGHLGLNTAIANACHMKRIPTLAGTGRAKRNYIYVHDLALQIVRAVQQKVQGVHLIANREVLSISDMLHSLCDVLLPGEQPTQTDGNESLDMVISPSELFGNSYSFKSALEDIAKHSG